MFGSRRTARSDHSNAIEGAADGSQLVLRSTGILGALSPNLGGALKTAGWNLPGPAVRHPIVEALFRPSRMNEASWRGGLRGS